MKSRNDDQQMDELIRQTIGRDDPEFDFEQWKRLRQKEIHLFQSNTRRAGVSTSTRLELWRTIMKNMPTRYATAAVIIVGVMVGLNFMNGSPDGAGIVWADTLAAFQPQDWIHIKYDNSGEAWVSLKDGKYFSNYEGVLRVYDHKGNSTTYLPSNPNVITMQGSPIRFVEGYPEPGPWERKTVWEYAVGRLETEADKGRFKNIDAERYGRTQYEEIETKMDFINDVELVRFDRYVIDATDNKLLRSQVCVDPGTRLPIRITQYFQNNNERTGWFDFPNSGPENIYDLGAPSDATIIDHLEGAPAKAVTETLKIAWEAYANMPEQYLALVWSNDMDGEVHIIYRNDDKVHAEGYYNHHLQNKSARLVARATAQKVLDWIGAQPVVYVFLSDGMKDYYRKNPHPADPGTSEAVVTVKHSDKWLEMPIWNFTYHSRWPSEDQWSYRGLQPDLLQIIDDIPKDLMGCIGLRWQKDTVRQDYYIDPEHNFICVKQIWWKEIENEWQLDHEYILFDLIQLPEGQWYAGMKQYIHHSEPRFEEFANIDIRVIGEDAFPVDSFNGEKLLETSRKENAMINTY